MTHTHIFNVSFYILNFIEVRQEAVQQALAALKNRPKESILMPSKRSSIFKINSQRCDDDNDSGLNNGIYIFRKELQL
jgi:hypothetical protein